MIAVINIRLHGCRPGMCLWWLLALFCRVAVADGGASTEELLRSFPQSTLTIVTPDARQHELKIWLATDDTHRERGLMFVRALPADRGMLFLFEQPQRVAMWMKNTLIPLDMLFIDANGRVDSVIANATPMSEKILQAKSPVVAVLELAGGTAKALNIQAGAMVRYPFQGRTD